MDTPETLAEEVSSLFSLPDLVVRACAVMDNPSSTDQDLIEVIELDANLVATCLRLTNSAIFAGRGQVETLTRAVILLGHRALKDLVLATAAVNAFRDIPEEFVDMRTFWENSTAAAVLARLMAVRLRLRESEGLFLAGLLHGVGRLVLYVRRPALYREALSLMRDECLPLEVAEARVFGFSHAAVGAALMDEWDLPERLMLPVEYQLDPEEAPAYTREVSVVHLAVRMSCSLAPCLKTHQELQTFQPDERARRCMDLLQLNLADLGEIGLEALAVSQEVIDIIQPATRVRY
ncbi:MAG: HDOD domain-containing protein [Pseudomonadota bacterium]